VFASWLLLINGLMNSMESINDRNDATCRAYLASLLEYLQGFHQRTQPLQSLAKQLARLEEEFDAQWEADTVPGWSAGEQQAATANGAATAAGALDVDAFDSVEELEQLGAQGSRRGFVASESNAERCTPLWGYSIYATCVQCLGSLLAIAQHQEITCCEPRPCGLCGCAGAERLKEALQALGLKAGGTLRQRAERLMLTKDTLLHQLDRKHFAPGSAPAVRPDPSFFCVLCCRCWTRCPAAACCGNNPGWQRESPYAACLRCTLSQHLVRFTCLLFKSYAGCI